MFLLVSAGFNSGFQELMIHLISTPQVLLKNEASGSWNAALVSVPQNLKEWGLTIYLLEWTSSADIAFLSTSPSAPPSRATSGGGYGKPAGAEQDTGIRWRVEESEGRGLQQPGRAGYSQRAASAESILKVAGFGEQGMVHKEKRMGERRTGAVQESRLCGRKCDAPKPRTPTPTHPTVCVFFSLCRSFPTSPCAIFKHARASHSMR